PSTDSDPLVASSVPVSIRITVVLPDPLGPMTPRIVPWGTCSVTLSTAATSPKRRETPSIETTMDGLGSGTRAGVWHVLCLVRQMPVLGGLENSLARTALRE